jgi:hypothetical protein
MFESAALLGVNTKTHSGFKKLYFYNIWNEMNSSTINYIFFQGTPPVDYNIRTNTSLVGVII